MQLSDLWYLGTVWLFLVLSACAAHVKIQDEQFCLDLEPKGAHCENMFSNHPVDMTPEEFQAWRPGKILITGQTLGDLKQELEELCSFYGHCDTPQIQSALQAMKKIQAAR